MEKYKKYFPLIGIAFLFYLATLYWESFISLIGTILNASSALIIGFVMAYIVNILMMKYEILWEKLFKQRYMKVRRPASIILSYLTVVIAFGVIMAIVAPQIVHAITIFVRDGGKALLPYLRKLKKIPALQLYARDIEKIISQNKNITGTVSKISSYMFSGATNVLSMLTSALSSVVSFFTKTLFGFMFSLYLLAGKETLIGQCKRVTKTYLPKQSSRIFYVIDIFNDSYRSFIIGQVTEALIIGVLCAIGCSMLRIPYASMAGTIVGVTALIPIAGAYIGALLSAFLIFTVNPMASLEFIIFIFILQQLEDNLIYPKIVGTSLGLPGLWVLASITIFGGVFGFLGMLLGVPMTSAFYKLLQNDLRKRTKDI